MSTLDLGKIKLVWRGAYDNSTAYTPDDVVSSGGSSYICILASTGNAVSNSTYWNLLAQGGTDVGTTLTTQGDILYRDGSGLQRLAAGTSGQVLQSGGSNANPSWGTVSSDWVKLARVTITSSTAYVIFEHGSNGVVIDSTYNTYKVILHNAQPVNQGENVLLRIGVGGTFRTSGYFCETNRTYFSGGTDRGSSTSRLLQARGGAEHSTNGELFMDATLNRMSDAAFQTSGVAVVMAVDGDASNTNQINIGTSGGTYDVAEANNSIRLECGSGNFLKATATLYGIK